MRPKNFLATARLKPGQQNKTEAEYEFRLEAMRQNGLIWMHRFHAIKLRLADNTYYSPDFMVIGADGVLELHEVKGWMMEAGNVKLKVAAENFPFRFYLAMKKPKKDGGGWSVTEV